MIEALEKLLLESRWFPKIPDVREAVLGDSKIKQSAEAEAAWLHVLSYVNFWHPDVGEMSGCPKLTHRQYRALQSAGGVYYVWERQDGAPDLPFIRKTFIEAYNRYEETEEELGKMLMGASESRRKLTGATADKLGGFSKVLGE